MAPPPFFKDCHAILPCQTCGASLPWLAKSGKAVVIPAGGLDGDPELKPFQNIFYESRADWYTDASELIKYDSIFKKRGGCHYEASA